MKRKRGKKTTRSRSLVLVVLILAIAVGGVIFISGLSPFGSQGNAPTPVVVTIVKGAGLNVQLGFLPSLIRIVIGVNNTVIWKNEDSTWHTAHSNIPEFDSKMIPPGASFTHTFQKAGSFPYHCDPHPWMTGLVSVIGNGSNPIFAQAPELTLWQNVAQFIAKPSD